MSKLFLFISVLFFLAGCGEESVNQIRPSRDDVSYSSSLEEPPLENELSSSAIVVESSSSSLYYISSSEESSSSLLIVSSSSEEMKSSSSSSFMTVVCGEMVDERDGQKYRTVTLESGITWMGKNLNYAYLQPTADLDSSSWCFDNLLAKCDILGRLYLWSAMMDSAALFSDKTKGCGYYAAGEEWKKCSDVENVRGICPEGWRLPTYEDFRKLIQEARASSFVLKHEACDEIYELDEEPFDEDQLGLIRQMNETYFASTVFWLAEEDDFAHGVTDDFYSRSSLEGWHPFLTDLKVVPKNELHAIRCVKDAEEVNE